MLRGAARRAREAGYILNIVGVDGEDERAVSEAFDAFEAERVAAILAVTLTDSVRNAVEQRSSDVPILVDPAEAHQRSGYMNEVGGSLVARHFADLGHRRVGMVLGPQNWLPARQRRQGFVATAEDAGLECVRFWDGDWSAEAGAAAAAQFDPSDGITAVFAANDAQAIGFIGGLSQAGFRVPDDVSVAGFDGTPESAYFTPSLTTIGADYEGQGRIAIDALLASIQGESTELPSPDVTLVARASTASPATALKEPNES
ncbi:substrate-binding domain-containing protein [Agromyces litoreus]|uniref:substrate-binding domain-containing protein n=1 Tax=Agromyces litoreus TaxID=3158561 RepID=UPI003F518ADE